MKNIRLSRYLAKGIQKKGLQNSRFSDNMMNLNTDLENIKAIKKNIYKNKNDFIDMKDIN
jgi:hypothetical protein